MRDRRRFLRTAAMTLAAARLGMRDSAASALNKVGGLEAAAKAQH